MKTENTILSVVQEDHNKAYRNFVKNTEKLIKSLKIGCSLNYLANNCEFICDDNCDGSSSKVCNIRTWVKILNNSKSLIPDDDVIKFLTYIISGNGRIFAEEPQSTLYRWALHTCNVSYRNFEKAKASIIEHLSNGKEFIDFEDKENPYANLLSDFLWEADSLDIIPGGNIVDFLTFI